MNEQSIKEELTKVLDNKFKEFKTEVQLILEKRFYKNFKWTVGILFTFMLAVFGLFFAYEERNSSRFIDLKSSIGVLEAKMDILAEDLSYLRRSFMHVRDSKVELSKKVLKSKKETTAMKKSSKGQSPLLSIQKGDLDSSLAKNTSGRTLNNNDEKNNIADTVSKPAQYK